MTNRVCAQRMAHFALVMLVVVGAVMLLPSAHTIHAQDGAAIIVASAPTTGPTTRQGTLELPADPKARADQLRKIYSKDPSKWPAPTLGAGADFTELGPTIDVQHPEANPFTEEKAELGKMLFFDPRLSGSKQFSCASCHDAELGFADGRAVAFGHDRQFGRRNSMGLLGVGHSKLLFWDGRSPTLEDQALHPITDKIEMNANLEEVTAAVAAQAEYRKRFEAVFGPPEAGDETTVTAPRIGKALATFMRTINPGRSDFDKFLDSRPKELSDAAVRGLHLFRTEARCINCHNGPMFSDYQFHNLGLTYFGRTLEDLGRYNVTKKGADVGTFKTPSLRNVSRTAPYMHNGLFDLTGVLNMYSAGMPEQRNDESRSYTAPYPVKDPLIKRLDLSRENIEDLRAFLMALEEPRQRMRPPTLPGWYEPDVKGVGSVPAAPADRAAP